jgi:hypothetical protein
MLRVLPLLLIAALFGAALAEAQVAPGRATADEAFVLLRHPPFVREVVSALYHEGQFYLPLAGVLRLLHVDATHDVVRGTVSGYYLDSNRRYTVDAAAGEATMDGRRVTLAGGVVRDSADVFVTTRVFDDVFGLQLTVDMLDLSVLVTTRDTLPLNRQYMRTRLRTPQLPYGVRPHAPLRFDRERQLARISQARYSATGDFTDRNSVASYSVTLAGEAAGGDAQLTIDGMYGTRQRPRQAVHGRWQVVLDSGGVPLTQVRAGNLVSAGLSPIAYRGVQFTNAPAVARMLAGEFPLGGVTEPYQEVELYVDDRLLAFTTADATGRYQFAVPLLYGAALLELRLYSPTGDVVVERRRLPVPAVFLPAGTTEYLVSTGWADNTGETLVQARVEHGVTRFVTAFAGYDRRGGTSGAGGTQYTGAGVGPYIGTGVTPYAGADDVPYAARAVPYAGTDAVPYAGAAARARQTWLGSVEVAPGRLARLSLSALRPSNASLAVVLTDYAGASRLNPAAADYTAALQALLPLRLGELPVVLRTSVEHASALGPGSTTRGELSASATRYGFTPAAAYRVNAQQFGGGGSLRRDEVLLSAMRYNNRGPAFLGDLVAGALRGTLASGALSIDPHSGAVRWMQLEASRFMRHDGRITLHLRHDRLNEGTSVQLRYAYTGRATHATSSVRQSAGTTHVAHGVRGTIGYDAARRTIEYSGRDWVGRSAVAFHSFVDYNGNGVPDAGEPRIGAQVIRFSDAVATRMTPDSVLVGTDLQAYRRYTVTVAQERVPNPLWVPRDTAFSFITDPNGYKQVYVPFFVAGVVEGRLQFEGAAQRSLSGVSVLIRTADGTVVAEEVTYSDGTFYRMGLVPGEYTAEIPEQVRTALRWHAEPVPFVIRPSEGGDIAGDVVLRIVQR